MACSTVILGLASAAGDARFYQHLTPGRPAVEAQHIEDKGWSIRGYEDLPMIPPIDWSADPHEDSNWRYQLNAMYPLAPAFTLLSQRYDRSRHEFVRSIFLDWIAFNIEQGRDHEFRWNDMATGIRSAYLAQLIWYEDQYGGEEAIRERLIQAAELHLDLLSAPDSLAESNHAVFQVIGIAALCEVAQLSSCDARTRYANRQFERMFWKQFNSEGMHLEHSPEYHLLALNAFDRSSNLLSMSEEAAKVLVLAKENLQHFIHPDGGFAEFGDTAAAASRRAGKFDRQSLWLVTSGAEGEKPQAGMHTFPESGYVSIRDLATRSLLVLTTAHHSRNHKHLDTGSFEWSDRGERVLIDSGKWAYDEGPERDYFLSQEAHNVIVTDGVLPSPGDVPDAVSSFRVLESEGTYIIEFQLDAPRRLVDADHRRLLLFKPGEWLIVVDEISEFLPTRHTQWFQLAPDADIEWKGANGVIRMESDRMLLVASLSGYEQRRAVRGQVSPMLGWHSSDYNQREPSWQIGFEASGRRVQLATLFRWMTDRYGGQWLDPISVEDRKDHSAFCWREGERLVGVVLRKESGAFITSVCEAG